MALGTGTALTGCSVGPVRPPTAPGERQEVPKPSAQLDPDIALAVAALTEERSALDALEATASRHRRLMARLSPVIETHRAHVSLLAKAAPDDPSDAPSATPRRRSGAAPSFRVPREEEASRKELVTAEVALSTAQRRHAFAAESGAFARLLASMAAAAAQHAAELTPEPASEPGGAALP
ncbi:MAG: hypothetical protein M3393_09730 [Actinomycetota bacterium]|nr:hypothetical protein [Actinomycetota bacterium]